MSADDTRAFGAIGAMFIELLTCQMALLELFHSQPAFDENAYREAIRNASHQLNRLPSIRTVRSQPSAPRIEEIEHIVRDFVFHAP